MTETAQRETPHVGIFWLVQTSNGEAKLLAAGCPLDEAKAYGDCLTYSPGHYKTWAQWRHDRTLDHALRVTKGRGGKRKVPIRTSCVGGQLWLGFGQSTIGDSPDARRRPIRHD